MVNLNIFASVAAIFSAIGKFASVLERNANSLDNLSQLGENYTSDMVKEQKLVQEKRLADLEAKVKAKYESEKKQWQI